MSAKKINKDDILKAIQEEAQIIKRKRELFEELKKMNSELKDLNECRGMAGTFGFKMPGDAMNKSVMGTGFEIPQDISHVSRLEKEMGGFGDEFTGNDTQEVTLETLKQENENLKRQLAEMMPKIQAESTSKAPEVKTQATNPKQEQK
jgi:hypothetical protein